MSDSQRKMTDAEIRQAATSASACGVIALQGIAQLGLAMREAGMPPEKLHASAKLMADMLAQYEAAIDSRFRFMLPDVRRLLDVWASAK